MSVFYRAKLEELRAALNQPSYGVLCSPFGLAIPVQHVLCTSHHISRRAHAVRTILKEEWVTSAEIRAATYGIFSTKTRLEDVLKALNSAGFPSEDICVFLSPAHPIAEGVRKAPASDFIPELELQQIFLQLSTLGGVVIPGVGFFLGSRDYLRALGQADCAPDSTGNSAALASLGIPAEDATRYEARLRREANLVFVSCEDDARSAWAREIMRRMRAQEVCLLGEFDELAERANGNSVSLTI